MALLASVTPTSISLTEGESSLLTCTASGGGTLLPLVNGNFASGDLTGWSYDLGTGSGVGINSSTPDIDKHILVFGQNRAGAWSTVWQTVPISGGRTGKLELYIREDTNVSEYDYVQYYVNFYDSGMAFISSAGVAEFQPSRGWAMYQLSWTSPANAAYATVTLRSRYIDGNPINIDIWADLISLYYDSVMYSYSWLVGGETRGSGSTFTYTGDIVDNGGEIWCIVEDGVTYAISNIVPITVSSNTVRYVRFGNINIYYG